MKATTAPGHTAFVINELEELLLEGNAHASLDRAIKDINPDLLGVVPKGAAYSIWQLVEHIRIAQWDIMEFSKGPGHKSPAWPDDYWPKDAAPRDIHAWMRSLNQIKTDRKAFIQLLHKAGDQIFTPFPYGDGQSLFREALVIADHTGYHTGEIIVLRRILGNWG